MSIFYKEGVEKRKKYYGSLNSEIPNILIGFNNMSLSLKLQKKKFIVNLELSNLYKIIILLLYAVLY